MLKKANHLIIYILLIKAINSLKPCEKSSATEAPLIQETLTTFVNVSVEIETMRIINPKILDLAASIILNQKWNDPRVKSNERTRKLAVSGQVWKPNIAIINNHNENCGKNSDYVFWRGYEEGNVLLSEKLDLLVFCTTNLRKFPFDTQICEIMFGTYRFPIDEVHLKWDANPIQNKAQGLYEFELANITTYEKIRTHSSGNFSVLVVQVHIKRYNTHYLYCSMIPSTIFALLSYISIWVTFFHHYSRYILNILSLIFLGYAYYQSLCSNLAVPYFKAIDKYILFCLVVAITSLIQAFLLDLIEHIKNEIGLIRRGWRKECLRFMKILEMSFKISCPIFCIVCFLMFYYYYM